MAGGMPAMRTRAAATGRSGSEGRAGETTRSNPDNAPRPDPYQAPDWKVEQLAPGVTRWTLPSGRTHITTPTKYDA